MKDSEMGGSCSTHGRSANKVLVRKIEGGGQSEDLGVDGKIILE
jgi:hypothetical protein